MKESILDLLPGVKEQISLKEYTTFRIGGPAKYFFIARTTEDIVSAVRAARELAIPFYVLGGGSNVLVSDEGFDGLVIKIESKGIEWTEHPDGTVEVVAEAGETWDSLVKEAVQRGLYGIENLSGIPGTVGASLVQNIGAYGIEVEESFLRAEVLHTETLEYSTLHKEECAFEYRDSVFKKEEGKSYIITKVALALKSQGTIRRDYKDVAEYLSTHGIDIPSLSQMRTLILEIRSRKFPDLSLAGTAGSFFKNSIVSNEDYRALQKQYPSMPCFEVDAHHVKIPSAWLLDHVCNMRGVRKGDVASFEKQPLILVNVGNASANEVREFAQNVITCVRENTGIELEPEVRFVGTFL